MLFRSVGTNEALYDGAELPIWDSLSVVPNACHTAAPHGDVVLNEGGVFLDAKYVMQLLKGV